MKDTPMGVSQWKEHGKKYGYWEFFKNQQKEEFKKVVEGMKDVSCWTCRTKNKILRSRLLKATEEL